MYAVYVTHEVFEPWIEWFENFDEALDYYHDMKKTPEHTACLMQTVEIMEDDA